MKDQLTERRANSYLLSCPVCGGRAGYCDDGPENQRAECWGDGKTETDGCGLAVFLKRNRAEARAVWNAIPRKARNETAVGAPDAKRPRGPWVYVDDECPPQEGIYIVLYADGTVGRAVFVSPDNWRPVDANGDMAPAGTRHSWVEAWSRTR